MLNGIRKLKGMQDAVHAEISQIPRGNTVQNLLRTYYWSTRMQSLGKRSMGEKGRNEVLAEAIMELKKENREFRPEFNTKFFNEVGKICKEKGIKL